MCLPHIASTLYSSLFLLLPSSFFFFFFFNDTATTEIYTLSLHDALPIYHAGAHLGRDRGADAVPSVRRVRAAVGDVHLRDRKSTRLNSSHSQISYAVFCLKKKKKKKERVQLAAIVRQS